jgi:hypothetical protein
MHRFRGLGRGGRLLLALAVGGAVFGIASVVQADIPDSGVIHGCYGKPGTTHKGELRVRDASQGEQCRFYENQLDWNQIGPTGVTGPTGPTGPTGAAGPSFIASGFVSPAGVLQAGTAIGPLPTITHPAPGQYGFSIAGLGTGCALPQLTGLAANIYLFYAGGNCGGGTLNTTFFTSNGADSFFGYLITGGAPSNAPSQKVAIPAAKP